jgi:hypothetical protein
MIIGPVIASAICVIWAASAGHYWASFCVAVGCAVFAVAISVIAG